MILLLLLAIIVLSFILIKATDILLSSIRQVALSTGIDKFGLTAFILALATSLPELFVAITAAVRGEPTLSLGNVIGSNIANLSLVMGGAAAMAGVVKASDKFIKIEVLHTFLAGSLPLLLLLDRQLTRQDGLVLLFVYLLYNLTVLRPKRRQMIEAQTRGEGTWIRRTWYRIQGTNIERPVTKFFIGISLLIFSADMLVRVAEKIANIFDLPFILVGMILVAVGTSLPELSFEIAAIKKQESQMALGNILGSVVANSTLILAVTALISPITLTNGLRPYLVATIAFILIFGLFWLFVKTKRTLERWEGIILVIIYFLFVFLEFYKLQNGLSY